MLNPVDVAAPRLARTGDAAAAPELPDFEAVYSQHFDFVWRNLRRLGVPPALVEDAAQDTFVVVYRRFEDLRPDASVKAWLFGIALRVAYDYRRSQRRKPGFATDVHEHVATGSSPFEHTACAQAGRVLEQFLASVDEDKRAVFVLAELEEWSAPEMSEALGVGINTIYSRLRAARERFVSFLSDKGSRHE